MNITGQAEDFLVKIQTELGSEIVESVLDHVSIDERNLLKEAEELPQLIFYYTAAYQRMSLRLEQKKLSLKEAESTERIRMIELGRATKDRITEIEQSSRLDLIPQIAKDRREIIELSAKREIIKGVLESLTRKGFSIQLIGTMRTREEDWLRQNFMQRVTNSDNKEHITKHLHAINQLLQ